MHEWTRQSGKWKAYPWQSPGLKPKLWLRVGDLSFAVLATCQEGWHEMHVEFLYFRISSPKQHVKEVHSSADTPKTLSPESHDTLTSLRSAVRGSSLPAAPSSAPHLPNPGQVVNQGQAEREPLFGKLPSEQHWQEGPRAGERPACLGS